MDGWISFFWPKSIPYCISREQITCLTSSTASERIFIRGQFCPWLYSRKALTNCLTVTIVLAVFDQYEAEGSDLHGMCRHWGTESHCMQRPSQATAQGEPCPNHRREKASFVEFYADMLCLSLWSKALAVLFWLPCHSSAWRFTRA